MAKRNPSGQWIGGATEEIPKEIPEGLSREVIAEMGSFAVTKFGGKIHIKGRCGSTSNSSSYKEYEMCKHCLTAISKKP